MARKITTEVIEHVTITDDVDGSELPGETKPVRFDYDGAQWDIYLSEANAKELTDALDTVAKFTTHAAKVKPRPARKGRASTGTRTRAASTPGATDSLTKDERASAKTWLVAQGHKDKGARGALSAAHIQLWIDAGKP